MADWTSKRTTDAAIRAAGALCCATSYFSIGALAGLHPVVPPVQPGALVYALAAMAFVSASLGMALLVLGRHIFDRIEVSRNWHSCAGDNAKLASQNALREPVPDPESHFEQASSDRLPFVQGIVSNNELPRCWRATNTYMPVSASPRFASGR